MVQLTQTEVDDIEKALGHALPGLYRKLLIEIGWGILHPEAEIYHPSAVWALYEPFFAEPEQLLSPFFPFGNNPKTQELWIIDADVERAASIGHETVPEDWLEEEWLPYEQWVQMYLLEAHSASA